MLFVCGLLLVGVVLRAGVRPIRALFIPASVVGGLIGLAVIQTGLRAGSGEPKRRDGDIVIQLSEIVWAPPEHEDVIGAYFPGGSTTQLWSAELSNILDGWPGLLIAVVFAGLLIERPGKRFSEAVVRAGRQGIVVWIIILGQIALGLLATALFIAPLYDIPPPFGQLIETGFAGGHGTAAAMGEVFRGAPFNFPAGRDLAFVFATAGLIWGVVSGIFLVNLAVRLGWVRLRGPQYPSGTPSPAAEPSPRGAAEEKPWRSPTHEADEESAADHGFSSPRGLGSGEAVPLASASPTLPLSPSPPLPSSFARIRSEIIDPLAFQLCLLAAAFGIGYAMQQAFLFIVGSFAEAQTMRFISNIPLFLFTLLGGWTLREGMHLTGIGHLIDPPSINRLCGIAMEILIVSALATLRIDAAAEYLWPVVILLAVGGAWCVFCLLWLSRRLLPKDYWFELGLINYGMSTATTAQGLLLLRIVDPDLESGAAEDYAAAAPLSAPFIGGGVLTVLGIPLALNAGGYWPVIGACGALMIGLYVVGRMLAKADDERGERRGFEVITSSAPSER